MNCSICLETFLNPRILLCGHTFCEECLKKSIVNYNLSCPTCRYKHKSMKVEDYPKNYILIELIEKMKQWFTQRLTERLTDWLTEWLTQSLPE